MATYTFRIMLRRRLQVTDLAAAIEWAGNKLLPLETLSLTDDVTGNKLEGGACNYFLSLSDDNQITTARFVY